MHDIDSFRSWLERRGRTRSADQYCQVVAGYLDDPESIFTKAVDQHYTPNYRRHLIACVRAWAKFCGDTELTTSLEEIKLPAAHTREARQPFDKEPWWEILSEAESAEYLPSPVRSVCAIIIVRGIRCGDILRLERREIDAAIKTGILAYEGKGEKRIEYSAAPMLPYLKKLGKESWGKAQRVSGLIAPTKATAGRVVRRAFDKIAEKLGIESSDLYGHKFRHTYATHFLGEMKGDAFALVKLQQQMGWSQLATATNYLQRSNREELNEAEARMLSGRQKNKVK